MSSSRRQAVHGPLDEVHRLGDPERARVRHAARRLVRIRARDPAVRGLDVVGAREDAEEPGRVAGRLRGGVERAVVGHHVDGHRQNPTGASGRDPPRHRVVAREARRHQVLRAVLHPLDRPARRQRAHHGAQIARIDRDLVAEAAADVRRDHADLVLRQAGDQREQRAVRVRRLGRAPDGQLARDLVVVGDRAARLERRRVRAREHHLLLDHHVRPRERGRARRRRRRPPSRRRGCLRRVPEARPAPGRRGHRPRPAAARTRRR